MTNESTTIGRCPDCETELHEYHVLIEFETEDGGTGLFADCPECDDVVRLNR
ncbi:hypothetical protein [Haloferax sp. ATB1]|uniref:DUF7837 family putative zinc-binding protein n=1 Tax=Haloferax sp. ATB1 TaxID=1508454 RepID=UPI0005B1DAE5|nr:hypothetical protein [Haloferax sp. ATB1]